MPGVHHTDAISIMTGFHPKSLRYRKVPSERYVSRLYVVLLGRHGRYQGSILVFGVL